MAEAAPRVLCWGIAGQCMPVPLHAVVVLLEAGRSFSIYVVVVEAPYLAFSSGSYLSKYACPCYRV